MGRSEVELPDWVAEANRLLGRRRRLVVVDDWPTPPQVGDVRIAEPTADGQALQRLVCVLSVDRRAGVARVVMVSNEIEMASEGDVVVSGSGCGLPFDLLVEARAVGSLWWIQMGRKVGRLDDRWAATVRRAADASPEPAARTSQLGAESPGEVRRGFQRTEVARLRALAADCEASVKPGVRGVPVVIDPQLFAGRRGESRSRRARRLLQVARELAGSPTAVVPREGLDEVLAECEASPSLGPDLAAALRPLLEGALSGLAFGPAEKRVDFEPRRGRAPLGADGPLAGALVGLAAANYGSVRLVVDQGSWPDDAADGPDPVAVRCGGRGRMQIIPHFLEVHS